MFWNSHASYQTATISVFNVTGSPFLKAVPSGQCLYSMPAPDTNTLVCRITVLQLAWLMTLSLRPWFTFIKNHSNSSNQSSFDSRVSNSSWVNVRCTLLDRGVLLLFLRFLNARKSVSVRDVWDGGAPRLRVERRGALATFHANHAIGEVKHMPFLGACGFFVGLETVGFFFFFNWSVIFFLSNFIWAKKALFCLMRSSRAFS